MKRTPFFLTVLGMVVLTTTTAFGWGFGTHAYVASEIGKRGGDPNLMEVYGATLPDLFNFAFTLQCDYDYLFSLTHDTNFMDVYESKNSGLEKWVAAGLVMHNQAFGIDHSAHIKSAVQQWDGGYVNYKAQVLNEKVWELFMMNPGDPIIYPLELVLASKGIDPTPAIVNQLYHTIIEYSADLRLKEAFPGVGPTLYAAATFVPDEQFPVVLVDAFADDVAAGCGIPLVQAIEELTITELAHRQVVTKEAWLLSIPDPGLALEETADHLALVGMGYLGIPYDPVLHAEFKALSAGYMQVALNPAFGILDDYFEELAATVELVEQNMILNGVIKK